MFGSLFAFDELAIKCPVCGCDYTHHNEVHEFYREKEDSPSYLRRPGTSEKIKTVDNPSSRRNAVRIYFWGECEHSWTIDFVQHKGKTLVKARQYANEEVI